MLEFFNGLIEMFSNLWANFQIGLNWIMEIKSDTLIAFFTGLSVLIPIIIIINNKIKNNKKIKLFIFNDKNLFNFPNESELLIQIKNISTEEIFITNIDVYRNKIHYYYPFPNDRKICFSKYKDPANYLLPGKSAYYEFPGFANCTKTNLDKVTNKINVNLRCGKKVSKKIPKIFIKN